MTAIDWVATPAVVVAIFAISGATLRALHTGYRWAKSIDASLSYIRHEMELNSGRTMRDAIDRIERKVNTIERERLPHIESQLPGRSDDT